MRPKKSLEPSKLVVEKLATRKKAHALGPVPLVARSDPPKQSEYRAYLPHLRYDFFYLCAYCTMTEREATSIGFEIDHYEPVAARPELKTHYPNLMYSCEECNGRKSDYSPSAAAREKGYRFFRADQDIFGEHFGLREDLSLSGKSRVGQFTVDVVSLNREHALKLRSFRKRVRETQFAVADGIAGLRGLPIDQFPPELRGLVAKMIAETSDEAEGLLNTVDAYIRAEAQSPIHSESIPAEQIKAEESARRERLAYLDSVFDEGLRVRDQKKLATKINRRLPRAPAKSQGSRRRVIP